MNGPHAVLKTTESAFTNFIRDKYTTLKEIDDRILSTSIDLSYTFSPVAIPKPTDADVEGFVIPVRLSAVVLREHLPH
jgi:urate oxidase